MQPPTGGCVLKPTVNALIKAYAFAAAYGRLCVETDNGGGEKNWMLGSRLRAAVC